MLTAIDIDGDASLVSEIVVPRSAQHPLGVQKRG